MIPQYFLFMTMLNMTPYCSVVTSQWFWCHDNDEFWHYNRHCTLRILISESFFVTLKSWHNIQVCCHNAECSCHSSELCHHSALFCLQHVKFWSCNSPFDNTFWQYHTLLLRYITETWCSPTLWCHNTSLFLLVLSFAFTILRLSSEPRGKSHSLFIMDRPSGIKVL